MSFGCGVMVELGSVSLFPFIWMAPGMMLCFFISLLDLLILNVSLKMCDVSVRSVGLWGSDVMEIWVAPAAMLPELRSMEIWMACSAASALWYLVAILLASSRLASRGSWLVSQVWPSSMV